MIQNIDDILTIMKEEVAKKTEEDEARQAEGKEPEEQNRLYLVVEHDEIRQLFFDLKKAGYEPINQI
jgi:hypothetical protein